MKIYEIVFSPTGGTKKAADCVAEAFGRERQEIDLSDRTMKFSDMIFEETDLCLFALPAFGGRIPDVCRSRIAEMTGRGACAVLLISYGNRAYDDAMLELQALLADRSFRCVAAIGAVTEHSIMHQFGAGRPDEADQKELFSFGKRISENLKNEEGESVLELPGNYPYREYHGIPLKPKANKNCDGCGICAQQCPSGAILADRPKETDSNLCISCMRCVAVCPRHARELNKLLLEASVLKLKKECAGHKKNELFCCK